MEFNATNLFERPFRRFHNAESWWTAYFTMVVLWVSSNGKSVDVHWYHTNNNGNFKEGGTVSFSGATYVNLVADAKLYGELFGIPNWPNKFLNLRPDVTYLKSIEDRKVVFVETKTIGANARDKADLYAKLVEFFLKEKWSAELYYLISMGHEESRDWPPLANLSARIISWENIFDIAESTPLGKLFGEPLSKYCQAQQGAVADRS